MIQISTLPNYTIDYLLPYFLLQRARLFLRKFVKYEDVSLYLRSTLQSLHFQYVCSQIRKPFSLQGPYKKLNSGELISQNSIYLLFFGFLISLHISDYFILEIMVRIMAMRKLKNLLAKKIDNNNNNSEMKYILRFERNNIIS